jgi:hypothetical protein
MNLLFYVGLVVSYLSWSAFNYKLIDSSLVWLVKLSPILAAYVTYVYLLCSSKYYSKNLFKTTMSAIGIGTCYSVWLIANHFLVTAVLSGQRLAILGYAALVALFLGIYKCTKWKFHSKQP